MENRQNKSPEGGAASGHGGQKFHTDSEQAKLHKSKLRMESREERLALYRAMQRLDPETREVIYLRLAGEFSFREIGDLLGRSEVWARVRFYRGKEALARKMGGDGHGGQ